MTTERKREILIEMISFIDDLPIGYEALNLTWEEWEAFREEVDVQ